MKRGTSTLWLLAAAVLLLCGCGGGGGGGGGGGASPPSQPSTAPLVLNIAGNWQINATSRTGSTWTIGGAINQSSNGVTSAVHATGYGCFDQATTINMSGALSTNNIVLSSASVAGQIVTLAGAISETALTGTYAIQGGCANGDQGSIAGIRIPPITGFLRGTFIPSGKEKFAISAQVMQAGAGADGTFKISGTIAFSSPCLMVGTIMPGTGVFPSGSFAVGNAVVLEIQTDNGTLSFAGTANPVTSEITGKYALVGGTCDQSGSAVLDASAPWDY